MSQIPKGDSLKGKDLITIGIFCCPIFQWYFRMSIYSMIPFGIISVLEILRKQRKK